MRLDAHVDEELGLPHRQLNDLTDRLHDVVNTADVVESDVGNVPVDSILLRGESVVYC
jgi:hypothetical protein